MLTRAFFPIDFSKLIDKILHICFSFGLVKFETSLKVVGSFKFASSLTVLDAISCYIKTVPNLKSTTEIIKIVRVYLVLGDPVSKLQTD